MGAAEIGIYFTRCCLVMGSAGRLAFPTAGAPAPRAPTRAGPAPGMGKRVAAVAGGERAGVGNPDPRKRPQRRLAVKLHGPPR